jgi:PAS domain S-box-containing protein
MAKALKKIDPPRVAGYSSAMAVASDIGSADLGAVLKTALDAVLVMRLDGTIAGWNDVAERTFGWSFEEAVGRRMSEMIIPPHYREAHERGLAHYLRTGEGPVLDRHIEITALHRDGRELPVELSITHTHQFDEPVFLGFLRDITERKEAQRRQQLLLAELNHRVKNMLAVVAGIAHQTARASPSVEAFGTSFSGRLGALARAHEILTSADGERAELGTLVEALLGPYTLPPDPRASFAGPQVPLDPKQLLSLSMILHELITNATKYGALSQPQGRIGLQWERTEGGDVRLRWKESGLSGIVAPDRKGFGISMIGLSAGHELGGAAETLWESDGVAFVLSFPALRAVKEPAA